MTRPIDHLEEVATASISQPKSGSLSALDEEETGALSLLSIAISLKRIADALEVTNAEDDKVISLPQIMLRIANALTNSPVVSGNIGVEATSNLEQIAWSLGRSFEQGRRTDR